MTSEKDNSHIDLRPDSANLSEFDLGQRTASASHRLHLHRRAIIPLARCRAEARHVRRPILVHDLDMEVESGAEHVLRACLRAVFLVMTINGVLFVSMNASTPSGAEEREEGCGSSSTLNSVCLKRNCLPDQKSV